MNKLIFISHSEADKEVAARLVDFLLSALDLTDEEILCTSVPGHQLPPGDHISQHLKADLGISVAVIALITRKSLGSSWVVFELGASWALDKPIVPILAPGLEPGDLPGPVPEYVCVCADNEDASSRLVDAVQQIASRLGIGQKATGKLPAKLEELLQALRRCAQEPAHAVILGAGTSGIRMLELLLEMEIPVWAIYDKRPDAEGLPLARQHQVPLYYGSSEEFLRLLGHCRAQPDARYHFLLTSQEPGFTTYVDKNWRHLRNCVLYRMGRNFPPDFSKQDLLPLFERT